MLQKTFQNNNNNMSPFTTPTKTTLFGLEDENTNRTPKTNLIPILPSTPYTTGSIAMQTAVTPAPVLIKEIVPEEVIEYSFEERRAGFVVSKTHLKTLYDGIFFFFGFFNLVFLKVKLQSACNMN